MLGDLISGGLKFVSGLFDRDAQKEANQKNADLQRDFAQNSIRWRAEDAKRAGIHPIYALGAPTMSATSSYVATDGMADALSSASQDIGRAVNATRTQPERDDAFTKSVQQLSLQKAGLENELLASQIAKLKASINPPMPVLGSDGVPQADKFEERPRMMLGGVPITGDEGTMNTDTATKRWGEMSDWAVGPYVAWRDYARNVPDGAENVAKFFEWARRGSLAAHLGGRFGRWLARHPYKYGRR